MAHSSGLLSTNIIQFLGNFEVEIHRTLLRALKQRFTNTLKALKQKFIKFFEFWNQLD